MTCRELIEVRKKSWEKYHDIEKDRQLRELIARNYILKDPVILKEIQEHPEYLIELEFVIVNKEQETVPFFLNAVQKSFIEHISKAIEDYKAGKRLHLNFMILKGRQQGFTSVITAYQLACSITRKNFSGFTLADDSDNTEAIFTDKAKYPYEQLPECLKPTEKYNNRRELFFENINSKWRVATAGNKDVGRSKTINFFHGSEAAFWDNSIQSVMASLGEALTKDSIKILESTANGYNEFKDFWDDTNNNWECLFYEWWLTSEYTLQFENVQAERKFKEEVENSQEWIFERCRWLMDFHRLSWEQLYWYYNKWKDLKELIKQEYPCSADEAFLASGRCVFNKEIIIMRKEFLKRYYAENPYRVGRFEFQWNDPETQDRILDNTIRWIDDPNGFIRIYEMPQDGYPYVLGGDTKGEGRDFYAGTVINNATGKRVAVLHGQWTNSKPYTWQMYCLGIFYNQALIGIEVNFNTAPIEELQRLRYPRQYVRKKYDTYKGKYMEAFGWKTDGNTRPLIIDKEIDLIENNIDLFTDIPMLDECLTFVYDENGRPDAEEGKHDDILFSDMIANEIRSQMTTIAIEKPKEKTELERYKDKVAKRLQKRRRLV